MLFGIFEVRSLFVRRSDTWARNVYWTNCNVHRYIINIIKLLYVQSKISATGLVVCRVDVRVSSFHPTQNRPYKAQIKQQYKSTSDEVKQYREYTIFALVPKSG